MRYFIPKPGTERSYFPGVYSITTVTFFHRDGAQSTHILDGEEKGSWLYITKFKVEVTETDFFTFVNKQRLTYKLKNL